MLKWRLIGAAATILPVLLLIWLDDQMNFGHPGTWLVPLAILVCIGAAAEMVHLIRGAGHQVVMTDALLASAATAIGTAVPTWMVAKPDCPVGTWGWFGIGAFGALVVAMLNELRRFREPGQSTERIAMTMWASLYIAIPVAFLINLRLAFPNRTGLLAIVSIIFVVKLSDAGAYFAGKSLGKHKMAPILSPKKTWEGAAGGVFAAVIGAVIYFYAIMPAFITDAPRPPWWAVIVYAIALVIAGVFGDLCESMLKRDAQTKDSSGLLPGLGGVLDVVDSLLLAAPVGYLAWVSGLVS